MNAKKDDKEGPPSSAKLEDLGVHIPRPTPCKNREGFCLDFSTFALSIATTAMIYLGISPHPESHAIKVDLELAKHNIDILTMLTEKTRGNLNEGEDHLLKKLVYDLRLEYVKVARQDNA